MLLKTTRGFSVCRGLKHLARKKFPWDKKKGRRYSFALALTREFN